MCRLFTILAVLLFSTFVFSQNYFSGWINENLLKSRVKQVEEFMARFNNQEDWEGNKMDDNHNSLYRAQYIRTLFNHSYFRKNNGKLIELAENFISDVVNNNYKIYYNDSTWSAKVICNATICSNATDITLTLKTEQVANNEYVWVISDVEGPMFFGEKETKSCPFISPVEHEVGFTSLIPLLSMKQKNVSRLFPKSTKFDKLSTFAFLIKNDLLEIKRINDVRFCFYSIPGYTFIIERVERKGSFNTGWLITKINSINK